MNRIIASFVLFIVLSFASYAQQGMTFGEFAQKIDPYFDKDLILDIKKELPQGSDYSIWGWDVGDFSGDGYNDVAFALKLSSDKRRLMHVYMFADIEGYLTKVGQFAYEYVQLPIEIGCVIRHNGCFVTKKNKQYDWLIIGYTFDNGALIKLDEYRTSRIGRLTHESYRNFLTLQGTEKYLVTRNGDKEFFTNFLSIPTYYRGRKVFKGYSYEPYAYNIDYVHKGAYYWDGEQDASFSVQTAYNDQYLYVSVDVKDDKLVSPRCDSCPGDNIQIWIDALSPFIVAGDRFVFNNKNKLRFRTNSEFGIFNINFYPGNFYEKKPYFAISTTDELESYQKVAVSDIKVASNLKDDGFKIKFRIPFKLLGFEGSPLESDEITEIGCTMIFADIDNQFREEEETQIATSAFSSLNPSSYGSLLIIPSNKWYGESYNIYKEELLKALLENGF